MAKMQVAASGAKADEAFFPSNMSPRHDRSKSRAATTEAMRRTSAIQLAAVVDEVAIDRIFNRSVMLSSDAIVDFVTQLCRVSEQVSCCVFERLSL
jgi:hypothetical protein